MVQGWKSSRSGKVVYHDLALSALFSCSPNRKAAGHAQPCNDEHCGGTPMRLRTLYASVLRVPNAPHRTENPRYLLCQKVDTEPSDASVGRPPADTKISINYILQAVSIKSATTCRTSKMKWTLTSQANQYNSALMVMPASKSE